VETWLERQSPDFFFEWLAKVRVWSLKLVAFLIGLRTYQHPDIMGKGKSVPSQAWSGPEGSRKLRFPDFMTTAQGGAKVVSHTHRPHLPPGNSPGTHFC